MVVYELPGASWRRCLLSPFSDILAFGVFLVAGVLLVAGAIAAHGTAVYVGVGSAGYLVIFEARSYMMRLQADSSGIVVVNRFARYRIPWGNVSEIYSKDRMGNYDIGRVLVIRRRNSFWQRIFSVRVYAALGMSTDARHQAARDLMAIGRSSHPG